MSVTNKGEGKFNNISEVGITEGLIGYWKLNGDANDYSGNGNHGTVIGPTVINGLKDLAYDFDGVNDYILAGDLTSGLSALTVTMWFKWDGTGDAHSPFVTSKTSGNNINFQFWIGSDNIIDFAYASSGVYTLKSVTKTGLLDGEYHLLSATVDMNSGILKLYADGVLLITHSSIVMDSTIGVPVIFGRDGTTGTNYGKGGLTDVRIYNRALAEEEIFILYKYGLTNTGMQLSSNGTLYLNKEIKEGL